MALRDQINEDLKQSMKAGDKIRTETLRSLRALVLEFEKSGQDREMTSDEELKLLTSAAKKRREAIELFQNNNRPELAAKEQQELSVITEYLPKQLTREEIAQRAAALIREVGAAGPQDIKKVIPLMMIEMKGKADGKLVQEVIKDQLSSLT